MNETSAPPKSKAAPPRWRKYLYTVAILVAFLLFSALLHLPHDAEHWSADFVTSQFSTRLKAQRQDIVLVYVTAATVADKPYVSPIDRGMLADVIKAADGAGAKVIGLDVLLDRPTEPVKDEKLRDTIRGTRARMVVGVVDESPNGPHAQSDLFLRPAPDGQRTPETGHLYFDEARSWLVVSDHVIRSMADPPDPGSALVTRLNGSRSFAAAIAHAAGTDVELRSRRIDWLLQPADGVDTFTTLPAELLLHPGTADLTRLLSGKIVLIGGDFDDRDQHLTPLSVSRDDFYPGLFIHAQVLAQLLENRSVIDFEPWMEWTLAAAAGLLAWFLGRRSGHRHVWLELAGVVGLVGIGFLAFLLLRIIFPYNLLVLAWLTGAAVGHYGRLGNHAPVETSRTR